ncbi:MAG: hypothetical protein RLZZ426_31 [Actinomycetota bacterium]
MSGAQSPTKTGVIGAQAPLEAILRTSLQQEHALHSLRLLKTRYTCGKHQVPDQAQQAERNRSLA